MADEQMTLGQELWALVEKTQGYAYISDAVEKMSDEEVLRIAEGALVNARFVVLLLEMFLELRDIKPGPSKSGMMVGRTIMEGIVVGLERAKLEGFHKSVSTNAIAKDDGDYPMDRGVRKSD